MRHHHLPEVYLRQWCGNDGMLVRCRRVGPESQLEQQRHRPREVGFEPDLNLLPPGCYANGLTDMQLENLLGKDVDNEFNEIVAAVSQTRGAVRAPELVQRLTRTMQVFAARTPRALRRAEAGAESLVAEERDAIARLLSRHPSSTELQQYLDPRMPKVAARAGLAATVREGAPQQFEWLRGDVHLVGLDEVKDIFAVIGIDEFVTFEEPVVEWEDNPYGLIATFSLSPTKMIAVTNPGTELALRERLTAAARHVVNPVNHRRSVFCSQEVRPDAPFHVALMQLIPWAHGESRG